MSPRTTSEDAPGLKGCGGGFSGVVATTGRSAPASYPGGLFTAGAPSLLDGTWRGFALNVSPLYQEI